MTINDLLRFIDETECYGHADEIRTAVRNSNEVAALKAIREAMAEAHDRARYRCAPIGPEGHVRNSAALRVLSRRIKSVLST